ncbi:MAG: ABC transporter permease [Malacoplasma sp.]|nr:ABC transporter permease [Malacoplasma sp.]
MNNNYQKIYLQNKDLLDFEVAESAFERVDIEKINRTDQVVGKPSKYIVDIFKRFVSNKWAVFFFAIFALIIILAILVPPISAAMGYSAEHPISASGSQFMYYLPARVVAGSYPTITVSNATPLLIQTYQNEGILVGTPEEIIPGVAYKITYSPYLLDSLKDYYPILGTDARGVDIWSKLWSSVQISLGVAFAVAVASTVLGTIYGSIAGAFAGKAVDTIMMRFVEIINGIPTIVWLLILGIVLSGGAEGESVSFDNTTIIASLIFVLWFSPAVSTRTYIMRNKDVEYVQACKTLGGNQARIIFSHMIPVIIGRISVIFVNLIPTVIFYEASLVFLGLKSRLDLSLGLMLYDAYSVSNISLIISPIVVFGLFTISAQIIANALNDAIDPRVVKR